jgi:methyl-accepting chemotaxis protein
MFKLFRRRLLARMMLMLFLVAVVPVLGLGFLVFEQVRSALEVRALAELTDLAAAHRSAVGEYFEERLAGISVLAGSVAVAQVDEAVFAYHESVAAASDGPLRTDTERFQAVLAAADKTIKPFVEGLGFHNVSLVCAAHGHVMYTWEKAADLGTNLATGPYRESAMARVWRKVKDTGKPQLVDLSWYEPRGEHVLLVGAPVRDAENRTVAVVVGQLDSARVEEALASRAKTDSSVRVYLIGQDGTLRSRIAGDEKAELLKTRIETAAAAAALEHGEGVIEGTGHAGEPALSAYVHLGLDDRFGTDFEWYVISEEETSNAFAAITAIRWTMLLLTLGIALVVLVLAFFTARGLARPVVQVSNAVAKVAEGDLRTRIQGIRRNDELGDLADRFNLMVDALGLQAEEITKASRVIASSGGEIATTSQQLAASSSETASAVSETTVTVEEVKQTASVAADKARAVAESARATAETSRAGATAVAQTVARMDAIQVQMRTVADAVVRLSEQSQAIGEIIAAVDDLAEQSNLLAVNASIEAAKAGEHGKGFAVVAQEVKSLAEQSKGATAQVRSILNDIQKATGAAVMATEQGSKAVEAGTQQSHQAGQAIEALEQSIRESAQAAAQIAASSQQQLAGVEQVTEAMEGIKQATEQNVEGAGQLEASARDLSELGERLTVLIEHYRY